MEYRVATVEDIGDVLQLHCQYHISTISEEDKKDGFVTTALTPDDLKRLITQEQGLFIAVDNTKVVAYVMAASWHYWSQWSMFTYMIEDLSHCQYQGDVLSVHNSYQYGPICIDASMRGCGILEEIFAFALEKMSYRFKYLVTFVNKTNTRSYAAHKRKLGLDILKEFKYHSQEYYEFILSTAR